MGCNKKYKTIAISLLNNKKYKYLSCNKKKYKAIAISLIKNNQNKYFQYICYISHWKNIISINIKNIKQLQLFGPAMECGTARARRCAQFFQYRNSEPNKLRWAQYYAVSTQLYGQPEKRPFLLQSIKKNISWAVHVTSSNYHAI